MGYRSEVALALNNEGIKQLKLELQSENINTEIKEKVKSLLECAEKHYKDDASGAECWYWSWLKWYTYCEDYPDVDFIENFMNKLPQQAYYFVRVGENCEDSEIRGRWWDNPFGLALVREIALECERNHSLGGHCLEV